jgi:hypothetical protein
MNTLTLIDTYSFLAFLREDSAVLHRSIDL